MATNTEQRGAPDDTASGLAAGRGVDAGTEGPSFRKQLGQTLGRIAARLAPEGIGVGALAEIRRMAISTLPPAFWRLYLRDVPAGLREPVSERTDRAWAMLIRAMAEAAPARAGPAASFGTALAATGYSEARFIRLLRAQGEELGRELRVAARWLSIKGAKPDWWLPAQLVLGRAASGYPVSPDGAEHRLASDYFREQARS